MYSIRRNIPRSNAQILEVFSERRRKETKLLKKIKQRIGENYPDFKRNHDVYFEVFRLQCLLMSPFLVKNEFNRLTEKLLKLEKECLSIGDVKKPFKNTYLNGEYYKFHLYKMDEIKEKYDVENCGYCDSLFHKGDYGLDFCVDCAKVCANCMYEYYHCECGDFVRCCNSLKFCECDECGNCKNSCSCY